MGFLDLFFPKYCVGCRKIGNYICDDCFAKLSFSNKTMCLMCGKQAVDGITHTHCIKKEGIDGCFIGLEYIGVMKKLIYIFKYQPYVTDVRYVLSDLFYEALIQKEIFMHILEKEQARVFIPIPLHAAKFRKRGYNHAKLLGEQLSKRFRMPVMDGLLRTKKTHIQAGLSKEERKANIKDVFALEKEINMKGKTVFLVDDIVTTGITMVEAAKVLKKAGAKKVYALALAGEY